MVEGTVPNTVLFGQFLVDQKKITREILARALAKQKYEESKTLRDSHRLLGQILLEDFHVFKDRVELNHYLIKFNEYKVEIEQIMFEAKTYGNRE